MTDQARKANMPIPETVLKCPRCASMNTKFCYYNNYSLSQPRYFCKNCRRYWTQGGSLRNVPVGGGCRKNKRSSSSKGGGGGSTSTRSKSPSHSGSTPSNNSVGFSSSHHLIRNGSNVQPSPVSFMAPLNNLSDYSIADIGANYQGLMPQVSSSQDHFNLMLRNVNTVHSSSGMEPWRFIQQQQLVQQYHHHHHPTFFDANSEISLNENTPLYEEGHVITPRESNDHKLLNPSRTNTTSTTGAGADAQMDLLKLERNYSNGVSRGQLMSRPNQYNWSGANSENRNANNNNGNSSSAVPTIAWTDLISGFNSASNNSTALHPF